jgi:hypothetical protein
MPGTRFPNGVDTPTLLINGEPVSLPDLDDVVITDPQDGDVLTFDDASGKWVNAQPAA